MGAIIERKEVSALTIEAIVTVVQIRMYCLYIDSTPKPNSLRLTEFNQPMRLVMLPIRANKCAGLFGMDIRLHRS